jgi:hypothetical protein
MNLETLYNLDPLKALNKVLEDSEKITYMGRLLWCSTIGDDNIRYGSYKYVTKQFLKNREYKVEFFDYMVSILFTDAVFNTKSRQIEFKQNL